MVKDIFTKSQAVAILVQAKSKGRQVDIFQAVSQDEELFQLTCDQLEVKLWQYIDKEQLAGVVDDPIFRTPTEQ